MAERTTDAEDSAKIARGLRALQRFSQRRRAAVAAAAGDGENNSSSSQRPAPALPMRFNPFGLLHRKRVGIEERCDVFPDFAQPLLVDIVAYAYNAENGPAIALPPLIERNEMAAATVTDLRECSGSCGANAQNGLSVDNTGSYHWAAEDVLAHLLLSNPSVAIPGGGDTNPLFPALRGSCVLELGAGVGLAGFFLAAAGTARRVILTDGNRRVTQLLAANAQRVAEHLVRRQQHEVIADPSSAAETPITALDAMMFPWQVVLASEKTGDDEQQRETMQLLGAQFRHLLATEVDYLVGADCLFFEAFHGALASIVELFLLGNATMRPRRVVFVAPKRGGSLERFCARLNSELLRVTLVEQYDARISETHKRLLESERGYDPDRHLPLLVVVDAR